GTDFPVDIFGFEFEQVPYLLLLCALFLFLVIAINGLKWLKNVQVGMTGERMLRRMRYMLFERVMLFRMARFRQTKSGEVIQSILGEIEPLGGFYGEVLDTPVYQGGLLCVYMTFIFIQDWALGLAAICLYPFQAWLIPKLQKKIVRLNKARAGNTRKLADTIGETVNVISDVHTNDTARWHMAQVGGRLYENTVIRLQLFKRKFTIKFINNFLNQLTPFFFYSMGGYLVIKGDLDFGSLVAVLAAYKDVAAPWKAVLNYLQRWTDFNSRYVFVVEAFSGDDVLEAERIYAAQADAEPLKGTLELNAVEGGPGTGGLTLAEVEIPQGTMVAVTGGGSGAREALLKITAGIQAPVLGRVTMDGSSLLDATLPRLGGTVAYVGSEPGIVARSMRENLLYGLFRGMPELADQEDAELAEMFREAQLTGNSTGNPRGDWVDYALAGVDGPESLDTRLLELIELVGLSGDLYSSALDMRLDAARAAEWDDRILNARKHLFDSGEDLSDVVEAWDPDKLNSNARLMDNLFYGSPVKARAQSSDYVNDAAVMQILEEAGARDLMVEIGWGIATEFSELIDALDEDSSVLDGFTGFPKPDIMAAHEMVVAHGGKELSLLPKEQHGQLIGLAFGFIPTRDRLDVMGKRRGEELLEYRHKVRKLLEGRDDFVTFDQDRFSPARTVSGNILHGQRRYDRKSAWKRLESQMEHALIEAGLRDDLIRLGLSAELGSGSGLSSTARRRIGLARGLIKRPNLLILDSIGATGNEDDTTLRAAVRAELPETTVLYAANEEEAVTGADLVIRISDNGNVTCTKPEIRADDG
ncbi:MAG: ABC transporter transmembrane domain-containing protein, partial [Pseudomonadota bacterium]